MRFHSDVISRYTEDGIDIRIRRRFLWWPLKVQGETRWLEFASWSEGRINIVYCKDWWDHEWSKGRWLRDSHAHLRITGANQMNDPKERWHPVESDRQFMRWCIRRGIAEASRSLPFEYPVLVRVARTDGIDFPEFFYLREINKLRWSLIHSAHRMNSKRLRQERRKSSPQIDSTPLYESE